VTDFFIKNDMIKGAIETIVYSGRQTIIYFGPGFAIKYVNRQYILIIMERIIKRLKKELGFFISVKTSSLIQNIVNVNTPYLII